MYISFKKILRLFSLVMFICLGFLSLPTSASAYSGSVAIFPPLTGGPTHNEVSNFKVDMDGINPTTIVTNLNYVQAVVLNTSSPIKSHLLISEHPAGESTAFSFTVPQPFQDTMISATVFFWGPDIETMQITHEHTGAPAQQLTAYKVDPAVQNSDGNVLWYFTTYSFSKFTVTSSIKQLHQNLPTLPLVALSLICLSTYFVLKRN